MDIQRNNVAIERLISEVNEQTVVDGEVALPGGIRDEARILHTDARLSLEEAQVLQDRVVLSGSVVFQILYTQGDNKPRALEASSTFSHQMALTGVSQHSRIQTSGQVLEASAQAVSGRMLLHSSLGIGARALEHTPVAIVSGVTGIDGLQTRTEEVKLMQHVGETMITSLLREEFDLPASLGIQETLYARAYPYVKKVNASAGHANIEGDMSIDAFHTSLLQDKPLVVTRHLIPFNLNMEIGSSDDEDIQVRVSLKDIAVSSVDAGEGSRVLRAEGLLNVSGSASRVDTVETLSDAYTLYGDTVALGRDNVTVLSSEIASQSVQSGKLMFELPEGSAPVRSVLGAFIEPTIADSHPLGDRQRVTGVLHSTVLYLPFGGDSPVSASQDTPFEALFQGALPEGAWVRLESQEVDAAAITSDRVELQYRLCLDADAYVLEKEALPIDVKTQATPIGKGGIVVVYPTIGETLWDLARKYRVTQESIQKINPNMKSIAAGKPVLVFQKTGA